MASISRLLVCPGRVAGAALSPEVLRTTFSRHAFKKGPERTMGLDARALGQAVSDLEIIAGPLPPGTVQQLISATTPPTAAQDTAAAFTAAVHANDSAHLQQTAGNSAQSAPAAAAHAPGQLNNTLFSLQTLVKGKGPNGRPISVQGPGSPGGMSPTASRQVGHL